jgi:hypothetical protein
MKHLLEDEYVSYNVHLAPIFEYEAPVGVSLRGLGAGGSRCNFFEVL